MDAKRIFPLLVIVLLGAGIAGIAWFVHEKRPTSLEAGRASDGAPLDTSVTPEVERTIGAAGAENRDGRSRSIDRRSDAPDSRSRREDRRDPGADRDEPETRPAGEVASASGANDGRRPNRTTDIDRPVASAPEVGIHLEGSVVVREDRESSVPLEPQSGAFQFTCLTRGWPTAVHVDVESGRFSFEIPQG